RAKDAGEQKARDALEVYYVCVVLGFLGLYRDSDSASQIAESYDLPRDLRTWLSQTATRIHLGGQLQRLDASAPEGPPAAPLQGQTQFIGTELSAIILLALNAIMGLLLIFKYYQSI
ncbi:MAG: DotU family type IV/VI secretion system protein, partial [Planctomycetales bacterium]